MDKPMSKVGFKLMALAFRIRDLLRPRMNLLKEVGIEPGFCVLDYGCGPGSYIEPLAQLVGTSGAIYALDINPLAIQAVQKIAALNAMTNIKTIESDCNTGLPNDHVDVVLLYDTFHHLSRPDDVLHELHRVLKSDGILSFSDHHMKAQDIITRVTKTGWFKLATRGKTTYRFSKVG